MVKSNITNILEYVIIERKGVRLVAEHLCGTFDLIVFNGILASYSALASKYPVTLCRSNRIG